MNADAGFDGVYGKPASEGVRTLSYQKERRSSLFFFTMLRIFKTLNYK